MQKVRLKKYTQKWDHYDAQGVKLRSRCVSTGYLFAASLVYWGASLSPISYNLAAEVPFCILLWMMQIMQDDSEI